MNRLFCERRLARKPVGSEHVGCLDKRREKENQPQGKNCSCRSAALTGTDHGPELKVFIASYRARTRSCDWKGKQHEHAPPPQHPFAAEGKVCAVESITHRHVRLRPDGLRLRAYRQREADGGVRYALSPVETALSPSRMSATSRTLTTRSSPNRRSGEPISTSSRKGRRAISMMTLKALNTLQPDSSPLHRHHSEMLALVQALVDRLCLCRRGACAFPCPRHEELRRTVAPFAR